MKKEQLQKIIGERIELLRESKGISQQVLAAMCNFEKGNMSRIEAGRTNPTISTLYKISQALEIKLTVLVDFEQVIFSLPEFSKPKELFLNCHFIIKLTL